MQLAKSIMLERIFMKALFSFFILLISVSVFAQYNSPYSRFGLGDLYPTTSANSRAMGGLSAGYVDQVSVNFNNPASYSQFQTFIEQRSKKISSGRIVLDAAVSLEGRTLIEPNTTGRFTSNDVLFSYLQVGLPLKRNWGFSFGLRPLTRIGYMINREEYLMDPSLPNDSVEKAITQFRGNGGSYLPNIGTGFGFNLNKKNYISFGVSAGYLFGNRTNTTLRSLVNDSVLYYSSDHTTKTYFNSLFYNAGVQYQLELNSTAAKQTYLRLGFSGNWKQTLNATQDVLRQTYTRGSSNEELTIDSIYTNTDVEGKIIYPASYRGGFVVQHQNQNGSGWLFGADYSKSKWSQFRNDGLADAVQDNWMVNVGGQIIPRPKDNYFSRVVYRFGVYAGQDYVKVQNNLPVLGASFGMGLPVRTSRQAPSQYSIINIAAEYIKRGNNGNLLKENLFRLTLGLNFTDLWFGKRKYE